MDEMLDGATLYWFTQSFPRAIYGYRQFFGPVPEFFHPNPKFYCKKPMGYSWHPHGKITPADLNSLIRMKRMPAY